MKVIAATAVFACASASQTNPIAKVLDLLAGMRSKIVAEGEDEQAGYEKYAKWCRDTAKELQREVADTTAEVADLQATIAKAQATIEAKTAEIGDLAASQQAASADLKQATEVRAKEHADYSVVAAELSESIDTLARAISTLERVLGGSLVQVGNNPAVKKVLSGLDAVVSATVVDAQDKMKLQAFLQAAQGETQAPEAAAYESHDGSNNIVSVLQDLLNKAESQKSDADRAERQAQHDFSMMKQTVTHQLATEAGEQDEAKKVKAESEQALATATGDLVLAQKELAGDTASLNEAHDDCEQRADEWNASMASRAHEINALDTATRVLSDKTGGAQSQAYGLVQVQAQSINAFGNVVSEVMALGRDAKDRQLAMLAMRIRTAATSAADPFAKIKGLIEDMVARLEKEAAEEASAKAFCDSETAKANAKKDDHDSEISKLTSRLDFAKSRVAQLQRQIATLTDELKNTASEQSEAEKTRTEEHASFKQAEADYEAGLEGVNMALKVLRDYFGTSFVQQPATGTHSKKEGAASSVIGILEVAATDFGRLLAEARETEESAVSDYEAMSEDNKISTQTKKQDIKYKEEEMTDLNQKISEQSNDRAGEQEEMDAVIEYLSKLNDQCVAKPEPYEERKRRREQEIEGLKNALEILEGQGIGFLAVKRHSVKA
mmetsp:Transcript_40431/g.90883  ORF Transcript_40431/g.90883 Transcript_40431/m.90883 type:complete len:667 (+) Transcript_40431:68-2068(+)